MSTPKITPRAERVVRIENDPYLYQQRARVGICRKIYEDGCCALFVGDAPVRAIHWVINFSPGHSDILLYSVGGHPVRLRGVSPQERLWLEESAPEIPWRTI